MLRLESFEMWSWRRMEKISWTDCVRNEKVLHSKREKGNWIGHILYRNCILEHINEGMIEGGI